MTRRPSALLAGCSSSPRPWPLGRLGVVAGLPLVLAAGCGGESDGIDAETSDLKTKYSAEEACAMTKVASSATLAELDDAAGLNRRAAEEIVAYRAGPDGELGTLDDRWFATLAELDAVRQVGPSALKKLLAYASAQGLTCGDVPVRVLAFNDFHGALENPSGSGGRIVVSKDPTVPPVDAGGAPFLATHLRALSDGHPNTVVAAAGDVIGATPLLSSAFHDEPTIESVNLMGLDVAAVGNHEFDEGIDELWRMQDGGCHPVDGCQDGDDFDGAAFPYLAANVVENATGETVFPSYFVKSFGAARVGFIGVTLEGTPSVLAAKGSEGLTFQDEADTVNALVPELDALGVRAIVLLIHEGGVSTGLYNECEGISGPIFDVVSRLDPAIDVVVSGHTNAAHICNIQGRLVTSAAHNGRLVTTVDLVVDEMTGEVQTAQADNVIVTRTVAPDADQTSLIARYKALVAPIANRLVGSVSQDLTKTPAASGESAMGDVIADAQLEATLPAGADIAFMNPGGIRADLIASQISGGEGSGEVTFGELFAVQPFANNLVTLTLTGAQIEQVLEQQWLTGGVDRTAKPMILVPSAGFHYTWEPSRPAGDRVDPASITLNGQVLEPATLYRVTVNAFLADGGDGFTVLKAGTDRESGVVDLDALEAFLAAHSPVAAPPATRITIAG